MRTYSSTLLFEDMLDYLPSTDGTLYNFAYRITHPTVTVIEANCGTTTGTLTDIAYELEGKIELATGDALTETRLLTLLAAGVYKVAIRASHSCISVGGICQACYHGTFLDLPIPVVGAKVKINPEYNYQTDLARGNGTRTVFDLTEAPADYTKALVVISGAIITTGYTIDNLKIAVDTPPTLGQNIIVHYYRETTQPFVGYLSDTFSGSLIGLKTLPTQPIHLRPSFFHTLINDGQIRLARDQLVKLYKTIPPMYIQYLDSIQNRLEKSLYISLLYGIYSNVNS